MPLPKTIAGVTIPDSPLALAAAALLEDVAPAHLYNHCMRTYVFAAKLFEASATRYDAELAFVASALHDLGLLEAYVVPGERFELSGADAAVEFLSGHGVSEQRAQLAWDAIALHMNGSIAARKQPEVAMVSAGAIADASGMRLDELSPVDVDAIVEAFPRLDFKQEAVKTMIRLARTNPFGQILHPFAEVGRRHIDDFAVPTIDEIMLAAPFDE